MSVVAFSEQHEHLCMCECVFILAFLEKADPQVLLFFLLR